MGKELNLSVDYVLPCIQRRIDELQSAIDCLQSRIANGPAGVIYGSRSHSKWQWQWSEGKGRKYLSNKEQKQIKALAQKKYEGLVLSSLQSQRDFLDGVMEQYRPDCGELVFESMEPEWKNVVEPTLVSQECFVDAWKSVSYRKKSIDDTGLVTRSGEMVRSKSELLIAEALENSKVPFRYEYPRYVLWNDAGGIRRVKIHPDFTCLNVRLRREIVWEHFGLMDKPDYARETLSKIEAYERSGLVYGDGFIYTMEAQDNPLNSAKIQRLIERFLL